MKKQFLNLGKALNKAEQKQINGGSHADDLHAAAVEYYKSSGPGAPCPTWDPCFKEMPVCTDMCMSDPGGQ